MGKLTAWRPQRQTGGGDQVLWCGGLRLEVHGEVGRTCSQASFGSRFGDRGCWWGTARGWDYYGGCLSGRGFRELTPPWGIYVQWRRRLGPSKAIIGDQGQDRGRGSNCFVVF